jgi:hypothetical protein
LRIVLELVAVAPQVKKKKDSPMVPAKGAGPGSA